MSSNFNLENPIKSKLESPAPKNLQNGRFSKKSHFMVGNFENLLEKCGDE